MRRRWGALALAAIAAAVAVRAGADATSAPVPAQVQPEIMRVLARLTVIPDRPHPGGYDRSCRAGHLCVFGPAWSDDVDVAYGRNGCDTRNDILARDMAGVETKAGTHGCVVVAGTLRDPYTGRLVRFTKAEAGTVNIDHVLPLAAAWDLGASSWTRQRRQDFANDPRNLVAVTASVNLAKGDRTPGEWTPPTDAGRCLYGQRYVTVAAAYGLPITVRDKAQLLADLQSCV